MLLVTLLVRGVISTSTHLNFISVVFENHEGGGAPLAPTEHKTTEDQRSKKELTFPDRELNPGLPRAVL